MTIVAIFGESPKRAAEIAHGLTLLSTAGPEPPVCLGHGAIAAEGYEAPDLLLVSQSGSTTSAKIAESYRRHGIACVRKLDGSYAFILYDRNKRLILATSDLMSRAPLAYWARNGAVVVSSRVLRVLGDPAVGREIDETYLAHLVTGFWSPPPGSTALGDVKRLRPGVALVAQEGRVQLVPADQLAPIRGPERAKHFWVESLWRELEGATARCLAQPGPCLSLSGGLDSAVLASAARPMRAQRPLETFSMVAPASGLDEANAIDATATDGTLVNHKVDCDDCADLRSLDAFDLPDDPFMTPLSFLPSRLRLWREVSAARFQTLVDGEGADELFQMLPGPRLALVERQWGVALRHLRAQAGRRALFARSFVLPNLPAGVGRAWARRQGMAGRRLPTFLSAQARAHPAIQGAGYEFYCGQIDEDFATEFLRWLSMPAVVGAAATHRHLAASFGLKLASPMLDRRVVEVVLGTPAEHLVSPVPKGYLRDAAIGRVPDAVRTRPKDNRWPEALFRRIVGSPSSRGPLRDPRVRERLGHWIRFERVESMLDEIAGGHELSIVMWQQLEGLVAFAYWYSRASREFGVV